MIYLQLFLSFLQVGAFSIGGGYAAMPLICQQVVEVHPWLTMQEFTDLVTIAEMTPGPIAVNAATFVGIRTGGLAGAIAATLGCITPSLFLVSLLAFIYYRYQRVSLLQSILSSLRPAVVALIAGAGLSILHTAIWNGGVISIANTDWVNALLFVAAFAVLRIFKKSPIAVMCCCGLAGLLIHLVLG